MFGLLISGRPVQFQPQTISPTQYAFNIPSIPSFSHIALFLLPGSELPPDVGATVWIQIPPSNEFKLLGALAGVKQSAIFKINGTGSVQSNGGVGEVVDGEGDIMVDEVQAVNGTGAGNAQGQPGGIVLGISIEPAANVEAQLAGLRQGQQQNQNQNQAAAGSSTALIRPQAAAGPMSTKVLAQRIIGNAFNFLSSFGGDTVPLKAFRDWWVKFEKKIELDPGFLEREQG